MKYLESVILILMIRKSEQILLVPEMKSPSVVSDCVVHILKKSFINSTNISIKFSSQHNLVVSKIMRGINSPVLINADEIHETESIDRRISNDVVVLMDEQYITTFLNESKWTAVTQFLVIMAGFQTTEKDMIDIFQQFWVNNIVKILLLVADKRDVRIFTFIPFNKYDCAVHKPILLTTWTEGQMVTKKEIIQRERVTNLNGCTLNASVINNPPSIMFPNEASKNGTETIYGIEGSILMEISQRLNFKWNLAEPKDGKGWGRVKPNPHGAVGEVFLKKSHFASGRFSFTLSRYKYLDMSVPISCVRECISWAVPAGAKKTLPSWITLYISGFHNHLWYLIFITITCITIAFRILSKASTTDQCLFKENIETIIYAYRTSLGSAVKVPKSSFLRIAFISWILYSFVILTAYQALMGSKLTVPFRHSNIDTFKDLLETDLLITGLLTRFKLVTDGQDDKDINAIKKRFKVTSLNFKKAIEVLISERDIAYMWPSTAFMYNVMLHPRAKGLIHFMRQCASEFYPVMLLQKNCPFTAKVNGIISALSEGGIICKWRREYVPDIPEVEPSVKRLSLNRMIGTFAILGAGLGAALVAFCAEHAFHWYSLRKKLSKDCLGGKCRIRSSYIN